MIASSFIQFKKEIKDSFRDRRAYLAALSYAVFSPALMAAMIFFIISSTTSDDETQIKIVGKNNAPILIEHLEQYNIVEGWDEKSQISLSIPDNFQEDLNAATTVNVTLQADYSEKSTRRKLQTLQMALNVYSSEIASFRLMIRGIDPNVVQPIRIIEQDSSSPKAKSAVIMGLLIIVIVQAIFFSSMNVAIDISAGERERNSLELLLSHPISTEAIVLGKAASCAVYSIIGTILTITFTLFSFKFVPLHEIGITSDYSVQDVVALIFLSLPLTLFAAALQLFVAFRAKNFKEAQVYITYVLVAPLVLMMMQNFMELEFKGIDWLPLLGQADAMLNVIKGEVINWQAVAFNQLTTLVITIGLLFSLGKMLKSEKTVFGL
ncbi:MAG: ABC transporter permease [Pseudomonadota bacterium]